MSVKPFDPDGELGGVLQQVSGQLRLSLGNIHSALERLAPPDARDADGKLDLDAAVLNQSYYRIFRLANNLSDAAGLDGPASVHLSNDDVVGLVRDIALRAQVPAELLGLHLEFRAEKASHIIAMNSQRLERLVWNLLSNAFKFTPKGGSVALEVRVGARLVELAVSDTGCGISQERMPILFELYKHTDRTDPRPHGLGLGLAICKRIAQEHGGTILATSDVGKGTTVTVSLPNRRTVQSVQSPHVAIGSGYNQALLELADALPRQAFTQKFMD